MRAKYFSIILFLLAGVFLIGTLSGDNVSLNKINDPHPLIKSPEVKNRVKPDLNFGNIPLYFTHNKGQVDKRALFYAKTQGYTLWITKGGLIFDSIGKYPTLLGGIKLKITCLSEKKFEEVVQFLNETMVYDRFSVESLKEQTIGDPDYEPELAFIARDSKKFDI